MEFIHSVQRDVMPEILVFAKFRSGVSSFE